MLAEIEISFSERIVRVRSVTLSRKLHLHWGSIKNACMELLHLKGVIIQMGKRSGSLEVPLREPLTVERKPPVDNV